MKLISILVFVSSFSTIHSRLLSPRANVVGGFNSSHNGNITLTTDNATVSLGHSNATGFVISQPLSTPVTISTGRAYTIGTNVISLESSGVLLGHSTVFSPVSSTSTFSTSIRGTSSKTEMGLKTKTSSSPSIPTLSATNSLITGRESLSTTSRAGSTGVVKTAQNSTTAVIPITVIMVSRSGTTSPVTYISTHTSSGSIKPTAAWMCTGPLCESGGGCIIPLFCASKGGNSGSWGLCCGWNPPTEGGVDGAPPVGGPQPAPDDPTDPKITDPITKTDDPTETTSAHSVTETNDVKSNHSTHSMPTDSKNTHSITKTTGSTSSCSTQTSSACDISVSIFTPTNGTTIATSTITISCTTVIGCSATLSASLTTSTANSTATEAYLVYPTDGASREQLDSISEYLKKLGPDNSDEIVLNDTYSVFIGLMDKNTAANLPDMNSAIKTAALDISFDIDPSYIEKSTPACTSKNNTELRKRDNFQWPAQPELRFLSQPKDPFMSNFDTKDYVYDEGYNKRSGREITVYVQDTGLNLKHPEFQRGATYRWLWPAKPFWKKLISRPGVEDDPSPNGHGSCVISKISGRNMGIAKYARIVVLKHIGNATLGQPVVTKSSILENLSLVLADVKKRNLQGKAVMNLSYGTPSADEDFLNAFKTVLKNLLVDNNIVVVTSSGNDGEKHKDINFYPALWARSEPFNNLITVGAVDVLGQQTTWGQRGYRLTISAPGTVSTHRGLLCASGKNNMMQHVQGTSVAAGIVSGLVAYIMSLDPSIQGEDAPMKAKGWLQYYGWPRGEDYPTSVWNRKQSNKAAVMPGNRKRAAADDDDAACPNGELSISDDLTVSDGNKPPPTDWVPAGWEPASTSSTSSGVTNTASTRLSTRSSTSHTSASSAISSTHTSTPATAKADSLTCNGLGGTDWNGNGRVSFDRNVAIFALNHLCGTNRPTYTSDPSQTSNNITGSAGDRFWFASNDGFVMSTNVGSGLGYWQKEVTGQQAVIELWLNVAFSYDQAGCKQQPPKKFEMPSGSECTDIFYRLLDGCDLETTTKKNGGVLHVDSVNGCVDYRLWAENAP